MNRRRIKSTGMAVGALTLTVALSACAPSGGSGSIDKLDRNDKGSLKVAYFNENAFYMQYGNAFQAMFPNIELEVVSTESAFMAEDPVKEMERIVAEQQPDVLYLSEDQYAALAGSGLLYDLDAVVKQDEFDLNEFLPSVIDLLKARGGGKLYGLSPSFVSQALYYNKTLFDQYGVPYPTDGMSWEDAIRLAARFPAKKDGDDALAGLAPPMSMGDSFGLIRTIGEAKGLAYADVEAGTVTIGSPEWKEIFQSVIDEYASGSIAMPSDGAGGKGGTLAIRGAGGGNVSVSFGGDGPNFLSGNAAMTIDGPMLMSMMEMASSATFRSLEKSSEEDSANDAPPGLAMPVDWDVVTVPADPSQPDVAGGMGLDSVFSIHASSDSIPAAWEFLKYANGEQLAKTGAKSSPALSSRTAFKKEADGKNVDAFYALGADSRALLQTLPTGFAESFSKLASEQIKRVVDGAASLDDALQTLQTQGQDLLTKAIADADAE
ncbi:extracellular solute-binding protein [Paenibacillaceae bacterium WGS1546]|uniref:extracellular solute-binding protein n=1 Tax=Cohnella sp. WGS1546 TaxID=3366810 RepID=UPI00372D01B3